MTGWRRAFHPCQPGLLATLGTDDLVVRLWSFGWTALLDRAQAEDLGLLRQRQGVIVA